jgi:NitT/TauT family transport system permease protein
MATTQDSPSQLGGAVPAAGRGRRLWDRVSPGSIGLFVVSIAAGLLAWQLLSTQYTATFLPSPSETWDGARELAEDGTLFDSVVASSRRILIGWGLGLAVGIPVGLLMGRVSIVRRLLDPYIEFFRFIPPIAFVTLAVIWLGVGESSKVVLIFYTTVFIVTLNTIAGVLAVDETKLRAAESLGANKLQIMLSVVVPASVPYMVTGARLAMGNSFLTIVSAEIVAAQEGLGALIWTSRNYGRTEWVFVGIVALGILGFIFDRVIRVAARTFLGRYAVKL